MPERDKAIIAVLIDTGIRRRELHCIRVQDVNLIDGSIFIERGKNGKSRTVYLGKKTRKIIRKYANSLRIKKEFNDAFWITEFGTPLSPDFRRTKRKLLKRKGQNEPKDGLRICPLM